MLPDLGLSRFFSLISNDVEVDDAVAMIYVAMANEPISPTDNSPHTRTTFFDKRINQYKRCVMLMANKRFSMNKTRKLLSRNDVTIAFEWYKLFFTFVRNQYKY